jgi:hypothetical protein
MSMASIHLCYGRGKGVVRMNRVVIGFFLCVVSGVSAQAQMETEFDIIECACKVLVTDSLHLKSLSGDSAVARQPFTEDHVVFGSSYGMNPTEIEDCQENVSDNLLACSSAYYDARTRCGEIARDKNPNLIRAFNDNRYIESCALTGQGQ